MLSVFVIALLLLTLLIYKGASHEIEEIFDAELAQTARMISHLALSNIDSNGMEVTARKSIQHQGHRYEKHISYQVWYRNSLVLRSESAPADQVMSSVPGFSDVDISGRKWRVFTLYPEDSDYRIYTGEDHKARDELTWEIVVESLEIFFWSIPILGILIYFTLSKGLITLKGLSEDVRLRDVNRLRPINSDDMPSEVLPLVNALNELLARLDKSIVKERRFTSDASHELRTPLSGIRLHAQLAIQSQDEAERNHALLQIIKAIDKSTYLIEQMLTLSRLDAVDFSLICEPVNLAQVCNELIEEMHNAITEREVKVFVEAGLESANIDSNYSLLRTVMRNLLDNAIRHTGRNTEIRLGCVKTNEFVKVFIEDNGPGIPDDQLEKVTQRFYRLSGQDVNGCGLGLSIVLEATSRLDGELHLSNRTDKANGLRAEIVLPLQCKSYG
jgi:two-component system sensor histidine kinase QseC